MGLAATPSHVPTVPPAPISLPVPDGESRLLLESSKSGPGPARSLGRTLRAYVALTKPRIIELLLVTMVPVMMLAEGGVPDLSLVLATLVGGSLAAGSANDLNC